MSLPTYKTAIAFISLGLCACSPQTKAPTWQSASNGRDDLAIVAMQGDLASNKKKLVSVDVEQAKVFDILIQGQSTPLTLLSLDGDQCSTDCRILGYIEGNEGYQKVFDKTFDSDGNLPQITVNQGLHNDMPCFQVDYVVHQNQAVDTLISQQFCFDGQDYISRSQQEAFITR